MWYSLSINIFINSLSAELNIPIVSSRTALICNNDFTTDKMQFYGVELDRGNHVKDLSWFTLSFNEHCVNIQNNASSLFDFINQRFNILTIHLRLNHSTVLLSDQFWITTQSFGLLILLVLSFLLKRFEIAFEGEQ